MDMRIMVPRIPGNCLKCREGSVSDGFWCPRCCEDAALAAPLCPANLEGCMRFLYVYPSGKCAKYCKKCHQKKYPKLEFKK